MDMNADADVDVDGDGARPSHPISSQRHPVPFHSEDYTTRNSCPQSCRRFNAYTDLIELCWPNEFLTCVSCPTAFILQEIVLQSKVTALGHQGQQLRSVQLSPRQQRQQLSASPANRQRSMTRSSNSEDEGNFRLRCVIAGQAKQIGTRTAGGLMLN
ncbi:GM11001 [Drosophila sechellia]|uniref:GM11001 n=1 Tax=Drosophila sechellia TaxID=7238 RepID=B4HX74_DROSE|nr:GM11001 [Drosophila sechellia]